MLTESSGEHLCFSNVTAPEHQTHDAYHFTIVLMFIVQLGAGLGGIAVLSHGMVYVDDNVEKKNSAALIGKIAYRFKDVRMKSIVSKFRSKRTGNLIIRVMNSDIKDFGHSWRSSAIADPVSE
jgi:hypothetical protein